MTKNTLKKALCAVSVLSAISIFSQTELPEKRVMDLTALNLSEGISLHIISPEPIQFVDLSTQNLTGDLPAENMARVKITDRAESDSTAQDKTIDIHNLGVITVVCQSFMAQYRVTYTDYTTNSVTNIQIQPEDMQPLENPKMAFSSAELHRFSLDILRKKKVSEPIRQAKNLRLTMQLNNIYVVSDYIFVDMTFLNFSNLKYDVETIKFSVEDKKIYKATNNQSIPLDPVFTLYDPKDFKKSFRNIYVFKKLAYPNSKVLKIRLIEEQLSGRGVEMKVNYSQVLNADTF